MKFLTFLSLVLASTSVQANPCSSGTLVFLTDIFCVKATCASIKGTEVDADGKPGPTRTLRTGAYQFAIRDTIEYWEAHCKKENIPTPCVDGDYCVNDSNTVIGLPSH